MWLQTYSLRSPSVNHCHGRDEHKYFFFTNTYNQQKMSLFVSKMIFNFLVTIIGERKTGNECVRLPGFVAVQKQQRNRMKTILLGQQAEVSVLVEAVVVVVFVVEQQMFVAQEEVVWKPLRVGVKSFLFWVVMVHSQKKSLPISPKFFF